MVTAVFWGMLVLSVLMSFIFAKKSLKKPSLKDFNFKKYRYVIAIVIAGLVLLYGLFFLLGQPQRGYIASICYAFAALLSIISFAACAWLNKVSTSPLRAGLFGKVISASLSLAGIALLFDFFSIWNEPTKLPFLLTGFGLGAVLSAFILRSLAEDNTHDLFAFVSLMFISSIIIAGSSAVLVIGALSVLGCVISTLITDKRWFPGLFLSHVFGIVAIATGAFYLGMMQLVFAGFVGTLISLVLVPVILFYTENKYRPAKSINKGNIGAVLETSLVPVLLISVGFILSYILGASAGNAWLGVAFASLALLSQSVFITAMFNVGERAKAVAKGYLILCAAAALLLVFAAYQTQMSSLIGSAAWIINLSKVEVLAGLLVGGFIAISCAAVSFSKELNGHAALIIALFISLLAGFILKAEAAAAILAGAFLVGIPIAWSLAISSLVLSRSEVRKSSDSVMTSIIFVSSVLLLIAPLLV